MNRSSNSSIPPRTRVRIVSHLTPRAFLHVEDALAIGKLRLFAGRYRRGAGAAELLAHYVDLPDARVLFRALADGLEGYQYREYKGTPLPRGRAISRVLTVQLRDEGKVYIELVSGPGIVTATGAIQPTHRSHPAAPSRQVLVVFTAHEAQRWAEEVLAYLRAWDVARALAQRGALGAMAPFELSRDEEGGEEQAA